MSYSRIFFRLTFALFAVIYISVITKFIDPGLYSMDVRLDVEAIVLTGVVALFVYVFFFLRKGHR